MTDWQHQGNAWVKSVRLVNGSAAKIVVVAERGNPKGIQLVVAGDGGQAKAILFSQGLEQLSCDAIIDALCFQERSYGDGRVPPIED